MTDHIPTIEEALSELLTYKDEVMLAVQRVYGENQLNRKLTAAWDKAKGAYRAHHGLSYEEPNSFRGQRIMKIEFYHVWNDGRLKGLRSGRRSVLAVATPASIFVVDWSAGDHCSIGIEEWLALHPEHQNPRPRQALVKDSLLASRKKKPALVQAIIHNL